MNHTLTVKGVYSDFKNKKEILEYYNSNKDFYNLNPLLVVHTLTKKVLLSIK